MGTRKALAGVAVGAAVALGACGPPESGVRAASAPVFQPIVGFADLHVHQFANLGFGGLMLWGAPFDPSGDIAAALPRCDFAWLLAVNPIGLPVPPIPPVGTPIHGPEGLFDLIGLAMTGHLHHVGGYPEFDGWPSWRTTTHQQAYYEWLERAHRGGLKLMVMHAVNNRLLCAISNQRPFFGCDDMDAADRQIEGALELERFVDGLYGGPGQGWYRIARSGREARAIIDSGKLAVVLGIEVDDLFRCDAGGCSDDTVRAKLDQYYGMGVRSLYPVHLFNNAFGGAAEYSDLFNFANFFLTGHYFDVRDCGADGVEFRFTGVDPVLNALFPGILPPAYPPTPHCNPRGLTGLGETLVKEMMNRKMIVDVDHMSALALNRTLEIAEGRRYPALVMGHTGFIENNIGRKRSEGNKTPLQLERLRQLGGFPATILHQGKTSEISAFPPAGTTPRFVTSRVPNDCGTSSKTLAQAYLYAVEGMQGGAVAFGSDFNGLAGQPAPRFGGDACDGDRLADQGTPFSYPFTLAGQSFDKSVVGNKAFDFNQDGMAHIGMYPDLIHDLQEVGVTDQDLRPLYSSVEAYVTMWEKLDNQAPVARVRDVTVSAGAQCTAQASIDAGSSDPDGDPITLAQDPPGPYPLGSTRVTLTVTDRLGASSSAQATVTVVDDTPPELRDLAVDPAVLWPPNHRMVEVAVSYAFSDNCATAASPVTASLSVSATEGPGIPTLANPHEPDWVVLDANRVLLRAERAGWGVGRTYEVMVTVSDASGNATSRAVEVLVPHDQGTN